MTSATISGALIGDTRDVSDDTGGSSRCTLYEVFAVTSDGSEHVSWHRFSDFERLHQELKPAVEFRCPKHFWNRFDEEVIARRKVELASYLQAVIDASRGVPAAPLARFLGLPDRFLPPVSAGGAAGDTGGKPVAHVGPAGWRPGQPPAGSTAYGAPGGVRPSRSAGAVPPVPGLGGGATGGAGGACVRTRACSSATSPASALSGSVSSNDRGGAANAGRLGALTPRPDHPTNAGNGRPQQSIEPQVVLDSADNVIVVSYILPVAISRGTPSVALPALVGSPAAAATDAAAAGGEATSLPQASGPFQWDLRWQEESIVGRPQLEHLAGKVGSVQWVGCPAWTCESPDEEESLSDALEAIGCHAVFLTAQVKRPHYDFCRRVLWPLLHNQALHWGGRLREPFTDAEWRAYCFVNKKMTDKVLEISETDSLIWVHDYQLLLLPSYLIRKLATANVGLSLHTPFPSSDIFRGLSVRDELLRAMLNADLVQFHLFEYARNFLACCKRMLGLEFEFKPGGFLGVECSGRHTMVAVACAGIWPDLLLPVMQGLRDGTEALEGHWPSLVAHLERMEAALPPPDLRERQQAANGGPRGGTGGVKSAPASAGAGRRPRRVQLLVGIAEVDRLKGTPLALHAYRQLLRDHPELKGRVLLAQVGLLQDKSVVGGHAQSTQAALDFRAHGGGGGARENSEGGDTLATTAAAELAAELVAPQSPASSSGTPRCGADVAGSAVAYLHDSVHADVRALVGQIEEEFPGSVWYAEACSLTPAQRATLWAEADLAFFCAVREGLNLLPLECAFVTGTLRQMRGEAGLPGAPPAGIAVSEFSPASLLLNGSYRLNPWSKSNTSDAMDRAIKADAGEREARAAKDLEYASARTSQAWSSQVVCDIKKGRRSDAAQWTAVGFGLNVRMVGMGLHFQPLNTAAVTKAYRASENRAIFLDWGGTLIPLDLPFYDARTDATAEGGGGDTPTLIPNSTLQTLSELAEDKANFVMVLSGLTRDKVDKAFGSARSVACAAEHGYWYRIKHSSPLSEGSDGWQTQHADKPMTWYDVAVAILEVYTARTAGTYIKKKGVSLTWKYDDADPEFGAMQAKELHHHLSQVLSAWNDVAVHTGKGYLEVQPRDINKGTMADFMCTRIAEVRGPPDFILCIGDDSADEFMFSALQTRYGGVEGGPELFTCTVGRKPSSAAFYLPDHERVVELLASMRMQSAGMAKFHSVSGNLAALAGAADMGSLASPGQREGSADDNMRQPTRGIARARQRTDHASGPAMTSRE